MRLRWDSGPPGGVKRGVAGRAAGVRITSWRQFGMHGGDGAQGGWRTLVVVRVHRRESGFLRKVVESVKVEGGEAQTGYLGQPF